MSAYDDNDWCANFCLSCDASASSGPYCSQACRMLDLHRGDPTAVVSSNPRRKQCSSKPSSTTGSNGERNSVGFQLPPPVDFSSHKRSNQGGGGSQDSPSKRSSVTSVASTTSTSTSCTDNPFTPNGSPSRRVPPQQSPFAERRGSNRNRTSYFGTTWS